MVQPTLFEFLKLPRELRDLVYHFLWQGYPHLVVPYCNKKNLVRYIGSNQVFTESPFDPDWAQILPAWLFINKAFHTESLALLIERSEWIRLSGSYHYPNTGTADLFGPGTAQVVTLHDSVFGGDWGPPLSGETGASQARRRAIEHSHVADDMIARGSGRTLHVRFHLNGENVGRFENLFAEDIQYLASYQCVDIATLVMYVCNIGVPHDGSVPPDLVDELRNWAQAAARIVFDVPQPEIKYEEHGLEVHPEVNYTVRRTTRHWYQFKRPSIA